MSKVEEISARLTAGRRCKCCGVRRGPSGFEGDSDTCKTCEGTKRMEQLEAHMAALEKTIIRYQCENCGRRTFRKIGTTASTKLCSVCERGKRPVRPKEEARYGNFCALCCGMSWRVPPGTTCKRCGTKHQEQRAQHAWETL